MPTSLNSARSTPFRHVETYCWTVRRDLDGQTRVTSVYNEICALLAESLSYSEQKAQNSLLRAVVRSCGECLVYDEIRALRAESSCYSDQKARNSLLCAVVRSRGKCVLCKIYVCKTRAQIFYTTR